MIQILSGSVSKIHECVLDNDIISDNSKLIKKTPKYLETLKFKKISSEEFNLLVYSIKDYDWRISSCAAKVLKYHASDHRCAYALNIFKTVLDLRKNISYNWRVIQDALDVIITNFIVSSSKMRKDERDKEIVSFYVEYVNEYDKNFNKIIVKKLSYFSDEDLVFFTEKILSNLEKGNLILSRAVQITKIFDYILGRITDKVYKCSDKIITLCISYLSSCTPSIKIKIIELLVHRKKIFETRKNAKLNFLNQLKNELNHNSSYIYRSLLWALRKVMISPKSWELNFVKNIVSYDWFVRLEVIENLKKYYLDKVSPDFNIERTIITFLGDRHGKVRRYAEQVVRELEINDRTLINEMIVLFDHTSIRFSRNNLIISSIFLGMLEKKIWSDFLIKKNVDLEGKYKIYLDYKDPNSRMIEVCQKIPSLYLDVSDGDPFSGHIFLDLIYEARKNSISYYIALIGRDKSNLMREEKCIFVDASRFLKYTKHPIPRINIGKQQVYYSVNLDKNKIKLFFKSSDLIEDKKLKNMIMANSPIVVYGRDVCGKYRYKLGKYYDENTKKIDGIEKNQVKADKWYTLSSDCGYIPAYLTLAKFVENTDNDKYKEYLEEAIEWEEEYLTYSETEMYEDPLEEVHELINKIK